MWKQKSVKAPVGTGMQVLVRGVVYLSHERNKLDTNLGDCIFNHSGAWLGILVYSFAKTLELKAKCEKGNTNKDVGGLA